MFNSKYSKLLTILLVIAIIAILGILIYVGIDWYKTYTTNADMDEGLEDFNGYVNYIGGNGNGGGNGSGNLNNNNINGTGEPVIDIDVPNNSTGGNQGGSSSNNGGSNSSSSSKPKYKGFNMVGKIEIPKTNLSCPVLETVTPKSIEVAVAVMYGPGINEIGNTVIIGHNYRNGTFFSNNKKLAVGDKIYLTDLSGRKVSYTITKKYTTGTDDFDYATRDTNGKREISLSTCTDDSKQRLIIWAEEK